MIALTAAISASLILSGCGDADSAAQKTDGIISGAKSAVESVADKAAEAAEAAKDGIADAAEAAKEAAGAVADKAVEVKDAVAEKVAEVKEAVADKTEEAKEAAAEAKDAAAEKAAEVKEAAAEKAEEVKAEAVDAAAAVADKAEAAVAAVAAAATAAVNAPAAGTIRMITEATFPPYEFRQGKEVVGIDVEICKAIAKALGKELKIEDVEFDSVLPSLIAGKAELAAAGITVTEDRKMQVDFSVPYVRTGIVFIFAKDKPFEKADDAKGKKIGVQNGTTSADFVRETLGQEPDMFDSPASAFAALKAGKVDAVIADIDPAKAVIKGQDGYDISDLLTVEEYAVAIKKGQPELLATINKVIEGMKDSGELDKITDEWTAKADAAAAAEEAAKPAEEAKPADAPAAAPVVAPVEK
ncbi:MAG: transporter substrate-binding domain-containing protein [Kiritimatiellae bacterium]|nr:transporter substrate-binding domain-containing protein [Kiritimatiellia bacterium]